MVQALLAIRAALKVVPRVVWAALAAFVVIAGLMMWSSREGAAREDRKIGREIDAANRRVEKRDSAARDTDADERVIDQRSVDQEQEALDNANSTVADTRPTEREFALACERLRRQPDGDRAAAAAGCRPSSRAQATAETGGSAE